ncbi:Gfo/Idh/MocA family oxidoreductase [Vibrio tubiashii]|uniref:Gfo/Idh/MocA family protein n=1 Tax=Vibrio tubiashii TaxID=29498 RepID=UPI00234E6A0F|nr:Gfo/Idh/MocA family oxidoreductase [Vibrio tubiashii]WCP69214.1 Gfo/Idh/MocA family oxidoreductase [Vibrio tubiashii]
MKVAIIGLGDIAQKAYLPVICQRVDVEPIFCTRNPEILAGLGQQYRVEKQCQDYQQLLAFAPDAVMIHAATSAHREIAAYFIKQGIPTFVDKPLADSAQDVEFLYELAEKHNQPLYVGFNRRHIPLYNQHIKELGQGEVGDLTSLRWEKHRYNQPGDIRTFVFDDFIHPLDSVNLNAQAKLDDVYVTAQFDQRQLARVDVQWQSDLTLLHASMDRQFGVTKERVSATYANKALEFDSFVEGRVWQQSQESKLVLKDWTPMLASKGFDCMIQDWLDIVKVGKLATETISRNIASHQLAEHLVSYLEAQMK